MKTPCPHPLYFSAIHTIDRYVFLPFIWLLYGLNEYLNMPRGREKIQENLHVNIAAELFTVSALKALERKKMKILSSSK
jgi:hypothetical protein